MDELKQEIRNLIVNYNTTIDNYNKTIKNISFADNVDVYGDINTNNIIASYTISYQDGSCQSWASYESMKYYLKGMIDGFLMLQQEYNNM